MKKEPKSHCPQNLALEVIGDKWTMLIVRDLMINGKHYFREFLQSQEGIASNILSSRLSMLEEEGIIYKKEDEKHKQKIRYMLTDKGIDLFPILMANARWSLKHKNVDKEDAEKAQAILNRNPNQFEDIMEEMRSIHSS